MKYKICCKCKSQKDIVEFGNNRRNKDGKQKYCKECGREQDKKHYASSAKRRAKIVEARILSKQRNRAFVIQYLLKHPCVDCGESDPLFLDFDHIDSKILDISSMVTWGWSIKKIDVEIEKCEVRCIKCHRVETAKRAGWYDAFCETVSRCNSMVE
tara:strand:+ start:3490 stop:3957 length:468 start_codon:yes stop_codon:yes gene_type:complete